MSTWDITNHYYSGQGVVLLGSRDSLGKPKGLVPLGNVSALKLGLAVSVLEHKESHTGQRATDLRLTTETKSTLSMTLENFSSLNLASALRAAVTNIIAGVVSSEAHKAYPGKVTPLDYMKIDTPVVTMYAIPLIAYVNDSTAWDFKTNLESGSVMFNDGSAVAQNKLGSVITAIAVGATTVYTVPNANVDLGTLFTPRGVTGADAAFFNNKAQVVTAANGTTITTSLVSTAKVVTVAAATIGVWFGMPFTIAYNYAIQNRVDAMTEGTPELYMRFEGLNTAETNSPVVVEVFKFTADPLKELSLIGDGIGQFVLEGSVLSDPLQTSGSKFFKQTMLT